MACVSPVKYTVRFNSMETDTIIPTRGIRQGDPLSPYLFLMVAEGLSCLIQKAEERGELEGIKICRGAPTVSHLLFADDYLILMHADKRNADCLRRVLDRYCESSGQRLSEHKSSIFFSENTGPELKEEVKSVLNIMDESLNDKYLGLPAMVGVDRSDCFMHLIDRISGRINGWR